MFESVVIPLDGSAIAARAIPYAVRIAAPGARITLVGVVEPPVNEFDYNSSAQITEQLDFCREVLSREVMTQAIRLRDQGFAVTTSVRTGNVTDEIIHCARDAHAEMLAMVTHGNGGVSRWLLGSVTHRVLHTSHLPVLVTRVPTEAQTVDDPNIDGIIVPLDGSAVVGQAFDTARGLATKLALPLHIVRVVDDGASLQHAAPRNDHRAPLWLEAALANARKRAEQYVTDMTALAYGGGIDATGAVLVGNPATTLLRHIAERPNALVVIAAHGEGGVPSWAFGSVAEKLITMATNPTLILRPATHHDFSASVAAETALA